MKERIVIGVIFAAILTGCSRDNITDPSPNAVILTAVKEYSGANQSIKVTYRITGAEEITTTYINNQNYGFSGAVTVEVPTVNGEAVVYDHGNFNSSANYYFILNLKNGGRVTTQIQRFNF